MSEIISKTKTFTSWYRQALKLSGHVKIKDGISFYQDMKPSLHKYADSKQIDIEAFMYSYLRLPRIMYEAREVFMAQVEESFVREGYDLEMWEQIQAPARRRKMYFDGASTLAVYINSVTDLDDMVGLLFAYSIEWNKIHDRLASSSLTLDATHEHEIKQALGIDDDNWKRLVRIWGDEVYARLGKIRSQSCTFSLQLIRGHYVDYKKAAQRWFEYMLEHTQHKDVRNRPLYFISSNTHSIVNTMTGWVNKLEPQLVKYLEDHKMTQFLDYWHKIEKGEHEGSRENFLWYILKKYEVDHPEVRQKREKFEQSLGIDFIESVHYLDINAQIFPANLIQKTDLAKKIGKDTPLINDSDALILNIDYPLGSGAYMVLSTILHNVNNLRGVYILGKASFLRGNLGDIALPTKIYDTYSENTITLHNVFTKEYFSSFATGHIFENQHVVSTKGTLLHPDTVIKRYFEEGYSIVEMEDGPYLNALYETTHFDRYPEKREITIKNTPIDVGIIHYASDTPYTKAITLGTRNLGYEGVEATYASSLAILKRIGEHISS